MADLTRRSTLSIPRPLSSESFLQETSSSAGEFQVNLAPIYIAEARRNELVAARGRSLIELANAFDDGYDAACRLRAQAMYEQEIATIASRKRRAIILRDEMPAKLKERGLTSARSPVGAEDIRDTMYYEDAEFEKLETYRAALSAVVEFLFGKMMSMNRLCKRAESLMPQQDRGGLGQHDPDGARLEAGLQRVLGQVEEKHITATTPRHRGYANHEKE